MPSLSNSNNLNVEITTQANTEGITKTESAVGSLEEKSKSLTNSITNMTKAFIFGNVIYSLTSDIAVKVKDTFSDVTKAAQEWQSQQVQLTAALQSTHDQSGLSKQDAEDYAEALSKSTPITRESALAAENMLLTFTNIHKDVFPQTTKAVADMATAMNHGLTPSAQELSSTAIMVGKALNDPENGLTRLMRVGVAFTQQQKDQIKAMQDAGDVAGAQKIILGELATEFGGRSSASADTFRGRMEMLKNQLVDFGADAIPKLEDKLNSLFTKVIDFTQTEKFRDFLDKAKTGSKDLWGSVQLLVTGDFHKGMFDPSITNNSALVKFIDDLRTALKKLYDLWITEIKVAFDGAKIAFEALIPSIKALWNTFEYQLLPSLKKLWDAFGPDIVAIIKIFAEVFGVTLYAAIWLAINAINLIMKVLAPLIDWMSGHKQIVIDFGLAFLALATYMKFDDITSAFMGNMDAIVGKIGAVKGGVTDLFTKISGGTAMGGIATAGALADIALVAQAVQTVMGAITAMNNANNAAKGAATSYADVVKRMQAIAAEDRASGNQAGADKIAAQIRSIQPYARGTSFAPGGLSLVGENGPELVNLPRGSSVFTNSQSQSMQAQKSGVTINQTNHIYNQQDLELANKELGWRLAVA